MPPLTTLVTRLMLTTRSRSSPLLVLHRDLSSRRPVDLERLETQPGRACRLGQRLDSVRDSGTRPDRTRPPRFHPASGARRSRRRPPWRPRSWPPLFTSARHFRLERRSVGERAARPRRRWPGRRCACRCGRSRAGDARRCRAIFVRMRYRMRRRIVRRSTVASIVDSSRSRRHFAPVLPAFFAHHLAA